MKLSPETWHRRYCEQARWTQPARKYLFEKAGKTKNKKILEVGCGTGAILEELPAERKSPLFGLDISGENLKLAKRYAPGVLFEQADACHLPFVSNSFDLVYTHFVLLWLSDPQSAMREMRRVTRPGGFVLALAEPDYGGRIDNPSELSVMGTWQAASLTRQGADPFMGRKLGELFFAAGLANVQSGVLGGEWQHPTTTQTDQSEWEILLSDFGALPEAPSEREIQHLRAVERQAQASGSRVLYVPTFYAIGQAPE